MIEKFAIILGKVASEFRDLNCTSKSMLLVSLMMPKFALGPQQRTLANFSIGTLSVYRGLLTSFVGHGLLLAYALLTSIRAAGSAADTVRDRGDDHHAVRADAPQAGRSDSKELEAKAKDEPKPDGGLQEGGREAQADHGAAAGCRPPPPPPPEPQKRPSRRPSPRRIRSRTSSRPPPPDPPPEPGPTPRGEEEARERSSSRRRRPRRRKRRTRKRRPKRRRKPKQKKKAEAKKKKLAEAKRKAAEEARRSSTPTRSPRCSTRLPTSRERRSRRPSRRIRPTIPVPRRASGAARTPCFRRASRICCWP